MLFIKNALFTAVTAVTKYREGGVTREMLVTLVTFSKYVQIIRNSWAGCVFYGAIW